LGLQNGKLLIEVLHCRLLLSFGLQCKTLTGDLFSRAHVCSRTRVCVCV